MKAEPIKRQVMPGMNLTKTLKLALLASILLALLAGAYVATYMIFVEEKEESQARQIDSIVSANLSVQGLHAPHIRKNIVSKRNEKQSWEQIEVVVRIDESRSTADLSEGLTVGLDRSRIEIIEETREPDPTLFEHQLSMYHGDLLVYQLLIKQTRAAPAVEESPPAEELRPRIALIVDDVGYDLERALELLNLRRPMSISIFPKLKYSGHIAETAQELGFEVMMHLPMEPSEKLRRNPGFITSAMTEREMYWVLDRNFDSIPFVSGVNNHQGSMMTANPDAMARLMKYLAKRNMFFIDSRTTGDSVAYQVAQEFGIRSAENNVFLDNEKDVEYIKERIELLMEEARQNGEAIGICHVHPATTQALHEMFPVIEEQGIELVFASELAKTGQDDADTGD